jgi:hypothetical protein
MEINYMEIKMKTLIHTVSHELHTLEGYITYNTVVENLSDPNNPFFYPHGSQKPHGWNQFNDIEVFVEMENSQTLDLFWSMAHQTFVKKL